MTDERVAIAGGGPAGLVAARHLAAAGVDVTVYEAAEQVGGRVGSRTHDGFTLDRGFQVLFTGYPAVRRELDLDALDLRFFSPGAVVCRPRSRSVLADSLGDPRALTETLFNREVTTRDKLLLWRLRRELRDTTRGTIFSGPDRSIREELTARGFSEGFVESFAAPFFGGITLDRSLSTSKRVFEYVMKVLAEGRTAIPAAGMGAIPAHLADRAREAGATVETGAAVQSVAADETGARITVDRSAVVERSDADGVSDGGSPDGGDSGSDLETAEAEAAIVATDPPTARDLTGVASIPTEGRPVVTQYYALPTDAAPDGKRLHLNAVDEHPNHLLALTNVAPGYGDGARSLVSATFLGEQDATNAQLHDRTLRALDQWYPERNFGECELLATDRIAFGQFVQPPGSHEDLPGVAAPEGRCYLAGEFTRWSSLNAAMESGREAAQRVLADV